MAEIDSRQVPKRPIKRIGSLNEILTAEDGLYVIEGQVYEVAGGAISGANGDTIPVASLVSATLDADGISLYVILSTGVTTRSDYESGFGVTVNGSPVTFTAAQDVGNPAVIVLTLDDAAIDTDTIAVSYRDFVGGLETSAGIWVRSFTSSCSHRPTLNE